MKVFITGNQGYIGTVLNKVLRVYDPSIEIIGYDSGYFSHCLTGAHSNPELGINLQYYGDIRDISNLHLLDIDAVIHLAGISNDPIGKEFESVTSEINREATFNLVKKSIENGVKNFVFASSCSMYGSAGANSKKETDETNPLTAYAKSKIGLENDVSKINLRSMVFSSLRFATACGWSNRLRLDLVLNDFVASAVSSKKITVLSDGSPWRPLIDVEDMSRSIYWAMTRDIENGGQFLAVNVGSKKNNFQVKDLAFEVSKQISNTSVSINKQALPDNRSYAVDFTLFEKLAPNYQPKISIQETIKRLYKGLSSFDFDVLDFRNSSYMRLKVLRDHITHKRLRKDLRWTNT